MGVRVDWLRPRVRWCSLFGIVLAMDSEGAGSESGGFKVPSLSLARPKEKPEAAAEPVPEEKEGVGRAEEAKETNATTTTTQPLPPSTHPAPPPPPPPPPLPYNEPMWSSTPTDPYSLTVIKNGTVVQDMALSRKPFHVFGRLPSCDVQLEHPSISRYHAILQYRPQEPSKVDSEDANGSPASPDPLLASSSVSVNPKEEGFYVYDLGSTHGTFINKKKIQTRCFYRLRLGQMVKFGGSSRIFLLEVGLQC